MITAEFQQLKDVMQSIGYQWQYEYVGYMFVHPKIRGAINPVEARCLAVAIGALQREARCDELAKADIAMDPSGINETEEWETYFSVRRNELTTQEVAN
jgi:hypothetical protein